MSAVKIHGAPIKEPPKPVAKAIIQGQGSIPYPTPKEAVTLDFNLKYVEQLLGVNIPIEQIKKILSSLDFKVSGKEILKII